jgi:hypothetical protein
MNKKKNAKKPVTSAKVNQVQNQRRELNVGELEQVYGALRSVDPGTKG